MKNKLEIAREQINAIDKEMIDLFLKRMEAVQMVIEYKKENNLPILDENRESLLKEKNLSILNSKELEPFYLTFLEGMLKASKDYQKDLLNK